MKQFPKQCPQTTLCLVSPDVILQVLTIIVVYFYNVNLQETHFTQHVPLSSLHRTVGTSWGWLFLPKKACILNIVYTDTPSPSKLWLTKCHFVDSVLWFESNYFFIQNEMEYETSNRENKLIFNFLVDSIAQQRPTGLHLRNKQGRWKICLKARF